MSPPRLPTSKSAMLPIDLIFAPADRCVELPALGPDTGKDELALAPGRRMCLRGMLAPCQPASKLTDTPSSKDVTTPGRKLEFPPYLKEKKGGFDLHRGGGEGSRR